MWLVGVWPAKYATVSKLKEAKKQDPTILHPFLAKFELRQKGILAAKVAVNLINRHEEGLEAPPSYFMELWRYREVYCEPDPSLIIEETVNGVSCLCIATFVLFRRDRV